MRKNSKVGRPPYEPTKEQRKRVSVCAGGGMAHEEIALAMGISRNTLEKYFEAELSIGAYERRMEVVSAMHKAALKGNVAAQKAFLALDPALAAPPEPQPEKIEPLGKKEQAQADAQTAHLNDPEWAGLLRSPSQKLQ